MYHKAKRNLENNFIAKIYIAYFDYGRDAASNDFKMKIIHDLKSNLLNHRKSK